MSHVCLNGNFFPAHAPLFSVANRAFRYGDALFETARFEAGELLLANLHFDRLFAGLALLQMETEKLNKANLINEIAELCRLNCCSDSARVRLQVFREGTGCSYLIEAEPIVAREKELSKRGYQIAICPHTQKATDTFANLKSSNYLPYVMADLFAKENGLDAALVLNTAAYVSDESKTNVFLIRNGLICTPSLDQGCVAGVMRRHVIDTLRIQNITVGESAVSQTCLLEADAIFLTNAIRGIQWVAGFGNKSYGRELIEPIWDAVLQKK